MLCTNTSYCAHSKNGKTTLCVVMYQLPRQTCTMDAAISFARNSYAPAPSRAPATYNHYLHRPTATFNDLSRIASADPDNPGASAQQQRPLPSDAAGQPSGTKTVSAADWPMPEQPTVTLAMPASSWVT